MVLLVVRTHQAVVYEMNTAAAPENAIAKRRKLLLSGGLWDGRQHYLFEILRSLQYKFFAKFSEPQSSTMIENTASTGIESRLL